MKLALLLATVLVLGFTAQASADPGPGDEVVFTAGDCQNPTVLSAHNTQDKTLHWLIRIDSRLVEEGTLAPGERLRREYDQPNDSEHFYRIRLGLNIDHTYFSDEGFTRLHCEPTPPPTTTPPPPPTTTPPPPTTTPPPPTTTPPPHTSTTPPVPCAHPPCETAHTGPPAWPFIGFGGLLIVGLPLAIWGRKKEEV